MYYANVKAISRNMFFFGLQASCSRKNCVQYRKRISGQTGTRPMLTWCEMNPPTPYMVLIVKYSGDYSYWVNAVFGLWVSFCSFIHVCVMHHSKSVRLSGLTEIIGGAMIASCQFSTIKFLTKHQSSAKHQYTSCDAGCHSHSWVDVHCYSYTKMHAQVEMIRDMVYYLYRVMW
jgi:hypothetical protein